MRADACSFVGQRNVGPTAHHYGIQAPRLCPPPPLCAFPPLLLPITPSVPICRELEFFYQNQEQQPGGDKPANLHPVRWRDRWQNRAGGKRNLLQPLPKGQVCPQDAQPVREMEPVDPLSPITIV